MSNFDLLRTGTHSDLKIHCGSQTFHVHEHMLQSRSRSSYFRPSSRNNLKQNSTNELTLSDESPIALAYLLITIYHGSGGIEPSQLIETVFPGLIDRHRPARAPPKQKRVIASKDQPHFDEALMTSTSTSSRPIFHHKPHDSLLMWTSADSMTITVLAYRLADRLGMTKLAMRFSKDVRAQVTRDLDTVGVDEGMWQSWNAGNLAAVYHHLEPYDPLRMHMTACCVVRWDKGALPDGSCARRVVLECDPRGWASGLDVKTLMEAQMKENYLTRPGELKR